MTGPTTLADASPPTWARIAAVASIVIAGAAGGLIGWSIVDLQCEDDCAVTAALVGVGGALVCAAGVDVVAVLKLRAMAEWRAMEAAERARRARGLE